MTGPEALRRLSLYNNDAEEVKRTFRASAAKRNTRYVLRRHHAMDRDLDERAISAF